MQSQRAGKGGGSLKADGADAQPGRGVAVLLPVIDKDAGGGLRALRRKDYPPERRICLETPIRNDA